MSSRFDPTGSEERAFAGAVWFAVAVVFLGLLASAVSALR